MVADAGTSPGYGNGPGYWNDRYQKDPEPFEWLENYFDLRNLLDELTARDKEADILHVGCGNSTITEKMYDDGYTSIVNIDTSSVVINQMKARNTQRTGMRWLNMDATRLDDFADASFDLVIDKSVLDTFACGDHAMLTVATYLKEVQRVLRPGKAFLCVSYGAPSTRLNLLQLPHLEFSLRQTEIPSKYSTGSSHYCYVCCKPLESCGAAEQWPEVLQSLTY